ncbi:MAG TPA: nitroreductase family protein [Tenuifilaceae bacterium]|nr:nitroreductase family protein [Tenuifilaceae bacterium]
MIIDVINNRRSTMSFAPEAIDKKQIEEILTAATLAPSAFNEQPWRFYVATRDNMEMFNLVVSTMTQSNQLWAKNASALIITAAESKVNRTGADNYHSLHDLGMATANLMAQTQASGLVSHPMSGFDYDAIRAKLNIPQSQIIGAIVAIGKAGSLEGLPERMKERALSARDRKPLNEVVSFL